MDKTRLYFLLTDQRHCGCNGRKANAPNATPAAVLNIQSRVDPLFALMVDSLCLSSTSKLVILQSLSRDEKMPKADGIMITSQRRTLSFCSLCSDLGVQLSCHYSSHFSFVASR